MKRQAVGFVLILSLFLTMMLHAASQSAAASNTGVELPPIPAPLFHNVTVYRDSFGVPHIYANETSDAYYALGYVMAQDRIFEMDLFRRSVAGRLSEIFGSSMLSSDVLMRTLGIYKIGVDTYNSLPPEHKTNLEQFARGVNRYIREWPDGIPLEYRLLSLKFGVPLEAVLPYPWTPPDSLAIAGMMGLMLTDTSSEELIRGAFMKYVEPTMPGITDFLMPAGWINATTIMEDDCPLGEAALIQSITQPLKELLGFSNLGSNNWVIGPSKSATGNALLCNDPHLDLRTPGINWEVHIKTNEFNAIGVMIPGGPVIYSGHNDYIAWGVTNLMADVLDLYYYVFDNPTMPTQYWYVDHWEPLTIRYETIKVLKAAPVIIPVLETRHGPLVSISGVGTYAFQWVGHKKGYGETIGFTEIMKAKNLNEWRQALTHMTVIIQNYVYADKEGNIAWWPSGAIPIRDPTGGPLGLPPTFGTVPSNGSAAQNEWIGWVPHDHMPHMINPDKGFIVTANNQPAGPGSGYYPYPWIAPAYYFDPGFRAERITELIKSKDTLTVDDMKMIQSDILSIPARIFKPYILNAFLTRPDPDQYIEQALQLLEAWDNRTSRYSVAATIFEIWYEKYERNTFYDEFGPYGLYPFPNAIIPLLNMTKDPTSYFAYVLFDNKVTPTYWETRDDIIRQSLQDAITWLRARLGDNMAQWIYGAINVVMFEHPIGFNVPTTPVPCDGDQATVNPASQSHRTISGKEYLYNDASASYRGIYECKDGWDTSWIVVPPGESGLVVYTPSPHFADQFPLWLTYQYKPCLFTDAIIQNPAYYETKQVFYRCLHDVAVTELTAYPTRLTPGTPVQIKVTVKNEGEIYNESFTLTTTFGSETKTETITDLEPLQEITFTYEWDTTGVSQGIYEITATASIVPEEDDTTDNVKSITVVIGEPVKIKVEPQVLDMQMINKTFTVNITVKDVWIGWRTIGVQFRLCFNSTLLQVVNITQGPFMTDPRWNRYGTFFVGEVRTDGVFGPHVLVGIMLYPNETGRWEAFPEGSGVLATITFKAIYQERGLEKPPLTCDLTLTDVMVLDDAIEEIPFSIQHGLYRMYPNNIADFNWDNKVDMKDIALISKLFGTFEGHPKYDPWYDTNSDGKIDMRDVALASKNFGWTPKDP